MPYGSGEAKAIASTYEPALTDGLVIKVIENVLQAKGRDANLRMEQGGFSPRQQGSVDGKVASFQI